MKLEAARAAAYTALNTVAATINPVPPIDWDNRILVDHSTQTAPYLAVDFLVATGIQKSLGQTKVVRYIGRLVILICVKEGTGTAVALSMADTLAAGLQMTSFSGLMTEAAMPDRSFTEDGWYYQPLQVPFWFDDIVVS